MKSVKRVMVWASLISSFVMGVCTGVQALDTVLTGVMNTVSMPFHGDLFAETMLSQHIMGSVVHYSAQCHPLLIACACIGAVTALQKLPSVLWQGPKHLRKLCQFMRCESASRTTALRQTLRPLRDAFARVRRLQ